MLYSFEFGIMHLWIAVPLRWSWGSRPLVHTCSLSTVTICIFSPFWRPWLHISTCTDTTYMDTINMDLKFYHKVKGNSLPKYFADIFTRNSDIHHYGTRNRDQLHYFPFKKTGASKCVRHSVPNLLNEIAPIVRSNLDTLSLEGFSSFYKSFVINAYDPVCHVWNCYICHNQ